MTDHPKDMPPETQGRQPGSEAEMHPKPKSGPSVKHPGRKLDGCAALITGGDSGIGRAVALAFADQGADVAVVYLNEDEDARKTKRMIDETGQRCLTISGDVGQETFCREAVEKTVAEFGKLDILVNNAGEQHPTETLDGISEEQLLRTFRTNILAQFFMTKAALQHLPKGSAIINTASVTAYKGSPTLLDYSSTKGAIVAFTRSLSQNLAEKGIRVNAVAPGPIWTPLIPATFPADKVDEFGKDTPMGRPGQPEEVAPAYVFLAAHADSSYISGQVIHVNGGDIVAG